MQVNLPLPGRRRLLQLPLLLQRAPCCHHSCVRRTSIRRVRSS